MCWLSMGHGWCHTTPGQKSPGRGTSRLLSDSLPRFTLAHIDNNSRAISHPIPCTGQARCLSGCWVQAIRQAGCLLHAMGGGWRGRTLLLLLLPDSSSPQAKQTLATQPTKSRARRGSPGGSSSYGQVNGYSTSQGQKNGDE